MCMWKRVEHELDGWMIDSVEQFNRLLRGAETSLSNRLSGSTARTTFSLGSSDRPLPSGPDAASLAGKALLLAHRLRRPTGKDERVARERAADDRGAESCGAIGRIFE